MELPIDTSALRFMCALSPRPVVDEETDQPVVDEQGRPLYSVSLVALGPAGAQVLSIRVGGEPDPEVQQGVFVKVSGLVASSWWVEDTFMATRIEGLSGPPARGAAT